MGETSKKRANSRRIRPMTIAALRRSSPTSPGEEMKMRSCSVTSLQKMAADGDGGLHYSPSTTSAKASEPKACFLTTTVRRAMKALRGLPMFEKKQLQFVMPGRPYCASSLSTDAHILNCSVGTDAISMVTSAVSSAEASLTRPHCNHLPALTTQFCNDGALRFILGRLY